MILSILIYAIFVGCSLAALILLGYKPRTEINHVFEQYRRSAALRRTVTAWFFVLGLVFVVVQTLRWPFFKYVFYQLVHLASHHSSIWEPIHAIGLFVLVVAEMLVMTHWFIYVFYSWRATHKYRLPPTLPLGENSPEILVMIACCDEDPEILERSLGTVTKLDYPNYRAYMIENSRTKENKAACTAVAERLGVEVLHIPNRGHKAGALNDALPHLKRSAKYIAVFDVDHEIKPETLRELAPLLEQDSGLAFVQTPQLYANAEETWTTRAAAMQEMLLYDSVLEAKGASEQALCCGSNFLMRIDALESVGGWDEQTVSEDLMTSFWLHKKGWRSLYHRKTYAVGIGPSTVYGYWKQQQRWATGNTSVAKIVWKNMWSKERAPFRMSINYLWSSGYYFITLALGYLATVPMLLLLFVRFGMGGAEWYLQHAMRPIDYVYLSVYPLYVAVALFPYVHMRLRGYAIRNLVLLQGLLANTVPVYVASVLRGLWRDEKFFQIAPKKAMNLHRAFWKTPQSYIFAALVVVGGLLFHMTRTENVATFVYILLFWTFVYTLSFAHFFIFTLESRRVVAQERAEALARINHDQAQPARS
ncbi:MAG: glycosyltransferase [Calditrichaeota bacterium]|nr:glycosyltransferase [Calditrichota bacterium]MCB9369565.1 glycosyltransferase [Calditrichota bacterium]